MICYVYRIVNLASVSPFSTPLHDNAICHENTYLSVDNLLIKPVKIPKTLDRSICAKVFQPLHNWCVMNKTVFSAHLLKQGRQNHYYNPSKNKKSPFV